MTNHLALLLLIAVTASTACGSTSTSTNVAPSPVRCAVAATPTPATVPASGGSGTLVVSSARECSWSASSQVAWIALAPPTEGQGNGAVRYTVAPNPAASPRRGTLVLGSQSAEITQEAATCVVALDRRSFELGTGEQTASVEVQVAIGCAWTARSTVPWISVVEGAQGAGAARVRFRVSANSAIEPRSGSLEIAGLRVDVRQLGGAAPAPAPGPAPAPAPACRYSLDSDSADVGPGQTDGRVMVQSDGDCSWTAVSDQLWLTVVTGQSGTGAGEVRYQAAANAGTASRTGHIAIAGAVFTLRQAACSYSIAPTSASFEARGGNGGIDVQTQAPCAWTADARDAWIDITSGGSGMGSGRVTYVVQPNTRTDARIGTITAAGRDLTITQAGETAISGRARNLEGSCPTRRFTVNGQRIRTTSSTDYEEGTCGDIVDGVFVRVKGIVGSDGVLTAIEVDF